MQVISLKKAQPSGWEGWGKVLEYCKTFIKWE